VTEKAPQKEALIQLENISLELQGKQILKSVTMTVLPQQIVTLIGPNGAGKTSLLKVMLGLLPASKGTVFRQPGMVVGYVPQRLHIPQTMPLTVAVFAGMASKASQQTIQDSLHEVGLSVPLDQSVQSLSGGEFQRLLLARALLRRPQILVLDEPAQGLDFTGEAEFYHLIASLRERYHCAVVMVSHDLHLVMAATDQVVCLNTHVCCQGRPESISQDPEYLQLFGQGLAKEFAVYHHEHDHHHTADGRIVCDPEDHSHG